MASVASTNKRQKKSSVEPSIVLPSSIVCQFQNAEGSSTSALDMPIGSTTKQMESLLNKLLDHEDAIPYAFYINDIEVLTNLSESLTQMKTDGIEISLESTLSISYTPLSVYRVRPVTRCSETMPGHTDAVLHVSYSPDGKRLASGSGDTTVRFWNVSSSMPMFTCKGHKNHVLCTAWAPDGNTFASADLTGEIRLWDPKTGIQKGPPLKHHTKWVTSLCFEPLHLAIGSCRLSSSSKDHTIKVWNTSTYQCEATISGHTDSVECVKWGGTGLLYSACRDRTIKVWAVDGHGRSMHKLVRTLTGHAHRINCLALSCDYVLRTGSYELGDTEVINNIHTILYSYCYLFILYVSQFVCCVCIMSLFRILC